MQTNNAGLAKPKLRGVIHLVMSPISLVAGLVMISAASELRGRVTLSIFTLTAVTLFTCSALYHRIKWSDKYRGLWRRIDHANIPILIAGTYTPFAVFLLTPTQRNILLTAVWVGALTTAFLRIVWLKAPRWLYVAAYILLGWAALVYIPTFYQNGGVLVFILILLGGVCYTAGGVVYALKKPNFNVNWFGFHELFHIFVLAAWISQYLAVSFAIYRK